MIKKKLRTDQCFTDIINILQKSLDALTTSNFILA